MKTDSIRFWLIVVAFLAGVLGYAGFRISVAIIQAQVEPQSYMELE